MNVTAPLLSPASSPDALKATSKAKGNEQTMEDVATQFEGVFMSMLLEEMRGTLQDGLFQGEGSDTYGAMFDMYMGQALSQSGALGVRQVLLNNYKQNQAGGV